MDSKMKCGRSVLRDLFIIICLFIPCIVIWLSNAVISLMWKVYAYVQSEWERFNDIYFDNTAIRKDVDPALLVLIKGEDSVTGPCCCKRISPSGELKRRKSKFRHHFLVVVNSVAHALLFVPEKIYAYVQRVSEDYNNIYGDSMVELPYTEPAFIAYLKGEEGAPFLKNPHIIFSKSDSRDLKNFAANNDIVERRKQRQGQNGKVTEGFSLVRLVNTLYCRIRSAVSALYFRCCNLTFRRQVNGEKYEQKFQGIVKHPFFNERETQNNDKPVNVYHSRQEVKLQETVAAHPVPSSPAFAVGSDQRHLFKCSGALQTAWNNAVNLNAPPNTGPKLWSSSLHSGAGKKQWNASPAVHKRAETQIKLFSEYKANGEVRQSSTSRSKAAAAGSASVCKIKTEKKVGKRVTPFLFSVANVDTPALTSPVKEKGKVMPSLILTSHEPVLPRDKAQDKEQASGVVRSNQVKSANFCADSQAVATHSNDTFSAEDQVEVKRAVPRVKQAKNKDGYRKSRKNPLSAHAHVRQTRTVKFCADFETVVTHNHVTSSFEEQIGEEPNVSEVKRPKNKKGCLKDTSLLGVVHSSQSCSANVSKESEALSTHSQVICSPDEQIDMEPEVSRVKRTKNKEFRGKEFRENASSRDTRSCHIWSVNASADSQVSDFQTNGKSSVEEQIVEEPSVARTKRTRNTEEWKQPKSWDAQACINNTKHPSSLTLERSTSHAKRKAESSSDAMSIPKQTEFGSRQIHSVDVQKTAEQRELMEVVESPPERAFTELPEPMEIGGEENVKIFSIVEELSEAKAPLSSSFLEDLESMETNQEESGIFFEKVQTEEMETDQASVFDEFSFAWENVMQSFLVQPAEELMETDQESVAASPCVAQLETVMETFQEPFQMAMPFGQVGDFNLPVATFMGPSEAPFTIPVYVETMETQEQCDPYKPVETKLRELTDAKRPLTSTVGMPKEETMLTNTPAAEESVVQTMMEPVVQTVKESVLQTMMEPVVQTMMEPVVQTVEEPVLQNVKELELQNVEEPVLQTVKEPAMPPLKEQTKPPPLVKTELPQSPQLSALIYSEHLQRMEDKLNKETSFVTIEQQQLVAVETDETTSASQLTMEQLQLVPEDPYFHDGWDSDSGSDDSSDDEYELDLATIDEFSELHAEPEHVQLIMKLLTEKELASEQ